jgi:hypothetical protein
VLLLDLEQSAVFTERANPDGAKEQTVLKIKGGRHNNVGK